MNLHFSGIRALIIGGSCDLAITLARYMINEGLFPIMTYRNSGGHQYLFDKLQAFEGKFDSFHLDFSDRSSLNSLFINIKNELDYLIDFGQGNLEDLIASAQEDKVYDYFTENISFRAGILKKAGRIMLNKKAGRLIFISSSAAIKPNPGQGFYAAAKLASEALYRNLGLELGSRGITAVSLRLGYINEGRGKEYLKTYGNKVSKKIPAGRPLTAREVAETILFYLSDNARGFNATEISMDGGLTAGKQGK